MDAMLNEASIRKFLTEVVEHLQAGRPDEARQTLEILDFRRLTQHGPMIDPAVPFGKVRVHDTANHVNACQRALKHGFTAAALFYAEAALARWTASRTKPSGP